MAGAGVSEGLQRARAVLRMRLASAPTRVLGMVVAVAASVALVSVQLYEYGGYYASDSAPIALILCALAVAGLLRNRMRLAARDLAPMLLIGGACIVGVASAVSHGLSYVGLSSLAPWLVFAATVCAAGTLRPEERRAVVTAIAWVGVAVSAFGILMFAGVIFFDFDINSYDGSLCFYFQYAPTSGAFFCAMGLLAIGSSSLRLRWAAFPALAALTLTLSGGAAVVALASFGALVVIWAWRLDFRRLASLVVQALLALAFCVVAFKGPDGWTLGAAVVGACVCALCGVVEWRLDPWGRFDPSSGKPPRTRLRVAFSGGIVLAVAAVAVCALALFGDDVGTDIYDFRERFAHMHDAIVLWLGNPLLGVGPGRWQYEFYSVRCMTYLTTYVHCGYLQLACEFGTFGFLFFMAALVLLMCGLARRLRASRPDDGAYNERLAVIVAVAALLLHAAIDWDFAFGEILLVLGILITPPASSQPAAPPSPAAPPKLCQKFPFVHWTSLRSSNEQSGISGTGERGVAASEVSPNEQSGISGTRERGAGALAAVLAVLLLVVSYVSWDAYETREEIFSDSWNDALATVETVEDDRLALADEGIETQLLNVLYNEGLYQEGIDFVETCGGHSGYEQSIKLARCLIGTGRFSDAEEVLIDAMWAEPSVDELFSTAARLFALYGLSEDNEDAYHEAVDHANSILAQSAGTFFYYNYPAMPEYW